MSIDDPATFRETSGTEVRYTTREALALLTEALERVDQVQPEAARPAVTMIIRSGIEMCERYRSLWGLPLGYTIELSRHIVEAGRRAGG